MTSFGDADLVMEALQNAAFDLAVLDIKLSGTAHDSIGVARFLIKRDIPFVFLTGMRADEVQAKDYPDVPVVDKPYQVDALMAALREVIRENGEPDRAA